MAPRPPLPTSPVIKLHRRGDTQEDRQLAGVGEEPNHTTGKKAWPSIITINVPVVYMGRDVMILMRAISITRAIGRGGP